MNREWISAVEGITDSAERSTIRRNLIDCNWSRENNQKHNKAGKGLGGISAQQSHAARDMVWREIPSQNMLG